MFLVLVVGVSAVALLAWRCFVPTMIRRGTQTWLRIVWEGPVPDEDADGIPSPVYPRRNPARE